MQARVWTAEDSRNLPWACGRVAVWPPALSPTWELLHHDDIDSEKLTAKFAATGRVTSRPTGPRGQRRRQPAAWPWALSWLGEAGRGGEADRRHRLPPSLQHLPLPISFVRRKWEQHPARTVDHRPQSVRPKRRLHVRRRAALRSEARHEEHHLR